MSKKEYKGDNGMSDEASRFMPNNLRQNAGASDSFEVGDSASNSDMEDFFEDVTNTGSVVTEQPKKKGMFGKGKHGSKGSLNNSLGLSVDGVREVQERLSKLTLAVTVAAAITIFAIAFAGYTVWQSYSASQALKNTMRSVVVAVEEIPAGTTITKDMIGMKDVPADYIAANATSDAGQFIGERANVDIAKNDQVTAKMVSGKGNVTSVAAQLSDGEVAISIPVSTKSSSGVGGNIRQGNTVNVLAVPEEGKVYTALDSVRVVALDAALSTATAKYSTVTLAVTPKEAAELLELAADKDMKFSLTLNPADPKKADSEKKGE